MRRAVERDEHVVEIEEPAAGAARELAEGIGAGHVERDRCGDEQRGGGPREPPALRRQKRRRDPEQDHERERAEARPRLLEASPVPGDENTEPGGKADRPSHWPRPPPRSRSAWRRDRRLAEGWLRVCLRPEAAAEPGPAAEVPRQGGSSPPRRGSRDVGFRAKARSRSASASPVSSDAVTATSSVAWTAGEASRPRKRVSGSLPVGSAAASNSSARLHSPSKEATWHVSGGDVVIVRPERRLRIACASRIEPAART